MGPARATINMIKQNVQWRKQYVAEINGRTVLINIEKPEFSRHEIDSNTGVLKQR